MVIVAEGIYDEGLARPLARTIGRLLSSNPDAVALVANRLLPAHRAFITKDFLDCMENELVSPAQRPLDLPSRTTLDHAIPMQGFKLSNKRDSVASVEDDGCCYLNNVKCTKMTFADEESGEGTVEGTQPKLDGLDENKSLTIEMFVFKKP